MILDFEVYPHSNNERDASLGRLVAKAVELGIKAEERVDESEYPHLGKAGLQNDLRRLACWGLLQVVDGYCVNREYNSVRSNAKYALHELLSDLAEVIVNAALLTRKMEGFPGYQHGYSTLLKGVIEDQDSLFHDSVMAKGDFFKEIITGAMWEGIAGGVSQMIPARIINLYRPHLDLGFTPEGLEIVAEQQFSQSRGGCWEEHTILKMLDFINHARHAGQFTPEQLMPLAIKYAEIMQTSDEQGDPILYDLAERLKSDRFIGSEAGEFPYKPIE
jgi:hypothetical protein